MAGVPFTDVNVFTSDREPMNEVAGPHAVLFDPENPAAAAQKIQAAWPNRRGLAEASLHLAKRWQPETMFTAYEQLYARIASTPQ